MAWFRPARNRDHPGDRPPKWAPMGRFGRVAIMLTVVAGVVIALLVIGTRSAAALDETPDVPTPQPPPWLGGRAEMPEHGFAMTVPDGWFAFDTASNVDRQVDVVLPHLDPGTLAEWREGGDSDLRRVLGDNREAHLVMLEPGGQLCGVATLPALCSELEFHSDYADDIYDERTARWYVIDSRRPAQVDLPAGPAFVIEYVMEYAIADGEPVFRTETAEYWFHGDDHLLLMTCFSDADGTAPDDDWLSIAETFEFLPAE